MDDGFFVPSDGLKQLIDRFFESQEYRMNSRLDHVESAEHALTLTAVHITQWQEKLREAFARSVDLGVDEDASHEVATALEEVRYEMAELITQLIDRKDKQSRRVLGIDESRPPNTPGRVKVLTDRHLDPEDA